MSFTLRAAEMDDLYQLNVISRAAKRYWGYPKDWMVHWDADLILDKADLQEQTVWVAELYGELTGFCAVKEMADHYEVNHLWVWPDHMGKGLGRALLEATLVAVGAKRGTVKVVSDPNAEAFYRKMGFETVGQEESYPPGRFLPVMRRVGR